VLRFDHHLKAFLTLESDEFRNYVSNPTKFEKVVGIYKGLPSIHSLSLGTITDAVHSSIVSVKNELYAFEEPRELQGERNDLVQKQEEIQTSHGILRKTAKNVK